MEWPLDLWEGVTANALGMVIRLELSHCDRGCAEEALTGTIPSALGELTTLEVPDLSEHQLAGPIRSEWGQLTALILLNPGFNQLTGPIPSELGQLARLDARSLEGNPLTGYLPADLQKFIGGFRNKEYLILPLCPD